MRTHLGEIRIFDQSAVIEVRTKILGLATAFGFNSSLATRMATSLSQLVRQLLMHREPGCLFVDLDELYGEVALSLRFAISHTMAVPAALREVFDDAQLLVCDGAREEIRLRKSLPNMPGSLSPEFLEMQRSRINMKSRAALLEELREKNQQLEKYNAHLEELVRERTNELEVANQRMQRDLDAGAEYVARLIPAPIDGPVTIDWRYIPSAALGGDTMGYHWIDDDHLAIYLLDVTGHGIDSALLAVSIINVVRSVNLPGVDFRHPGQVLKQLNDSFTMEKHDNKMFTMWYGVFHQPSHTLTWGGGGHPDALLYEPGATQPVLLASGGPMMGMIEWPEFETFSREITSPSRLYLFSDGVYEIHLEQGGEWIFDEFIQFMSSPAPSEVNKMDHLFQQVRKLSGTDQLSDDFSILEICFDENNA
ncbi:PP2C family protein-serine/threonine phosphatase [Blastopirellula marina]|uniref:PPM-type phosphatase domain-containing protein n=1 Tax=Blastopirellula marina TaxID=124 RepID=A0A2S8FLC1_9BACT|nr:SpoIIE family protein phosphatase [Blastopirellula marina]PQO32982.1 hypothetical protein C5Y98_17750 [Blastopirellula marina]PTL43149.1 hypothetical protein C5Y97_17760 [Blastopirellula marina]